MNSEIARKIKEQLELDILDGQQFEWGEQHWLQLDPDNAEIQPIVSVATVYPGAEQQQHTHSGYMEIVIGLTGQAVHWCNDRQIKLSAGKIGYISEGSEHRLMNNSSEMASFLSIVYSVIPRPFREVTTASDIELTEVAKVMNLDAIAEKFAHTVAMTVTLIDVAGNFLTDNNSLPEICRLCMQQQCGNCVVSAPTLLPPYSDLRVFRCKFGVSSIQSPIVINGRVLGYLGCGYGRMSADVPEMALSQEAYLQLRFFNRNQLTSVAETLSLVSASLVQLMINSMKEKEISSYRVSLSQEREMQAHLYNSLSQARLKFLESQVNPHFLFNTLNTIAQRAEMDGAATLATLTYSLSNLLRLSLGKAESLVTLEEELSYINDYLYIQKTRFPNKFDIITDIDPAIMGIRLPFMTVMVLIENSILHGFKDVRDQGKLMLRGYKQGEQGIIEVEDNGCGIPNAVAAAIQDMPNADSESPSLKGIGLRNIFLRLRHYYGTDFTLTLTRVTAGGTLARIVVPL